MDFLLNIDLPVLIQAIGYFGIFFIIFAESGLFFGFFLPGDSLLFTAGLLASQGYFNIIILVLLTTLGAIGGDQIGYLFGKKVGPKIFTRDESFFFRKKYIIDAENFYKKYGKKTIIIARFVPVVRTFVPILAGVGSMNYKTFVTYNVVGGLLWGLCIPLLGYFLGEAIPNVDTYLWPIILVILLTSFLPTIFSFIYAKIKKCMKR
ncbi:MAG: VTT domain-containing protein [Candidatus Nomurabacteria bacterium]|nr:VTT domain-containing protein [Candidatus Nomurabacteria bacterium]